MFICRYPPQKCVIIRHDIDFNIENALKLAEIEAAAGVNSTYFVLLTSDFYNVFSKNSYCKLSKIASYGHSIGLHFDETKYCTNTLDFIRDKILEECKILSEAINAQIQVVSMHRPSKSVLENDLQIPGIINSYSKTFFKDFKYLSDSRRHWREPVDEIISSEKYNRLHILTHAFWYNEHELSMKESLLSFIKSANKERYSFMNENFTNLSAEVSEDEVV